MIGYVKKRKHSTNKYIEREIKLRARAGILGYSLFALLIGFFLGIAWVQLL